MPTLVQNITTNDANKLQRNMSRKLWKTCVCESVNYAKVLLRVSPIRCRTTGINRNTSKNILLFLFAKLMKTPCRIDARKSNAKNIENDANMEPKWRSNSITNTWKNNFQKTSRKMMQKWSAKKLWALRGPWARSAGRGKEFLRRLQVKVPSCIQHPVKNKHPANN